MLSKATFAILLLGILIALTAAPAWAQVAPNADPPARPVLMVETGMHVAQVRRLAANADGSRLATASADRTVRVWDPLQGRLINTIRLPLGDGTIGEPVGLALSPSGNFLLVGSRQFDLHADPSGTPRAAASIYLVQPITGSIVHRLPGLQAEPLHLDFAADSSMFGAALGVAGFAVWDGRGQPLCSARTASHPVIWVDFSPKGDLAVATGGGTFALYRCVPGTAEPRQVAGAQAVSGTVPLTVDFSADGTRLAVGYLDSPKVDVFDGGTLTYLYSVEIPGAEGNLGAVAWATGGDGREWLVAGGTARHAETGGNLLGLWRDGTRDLETLYVSNDSISHIIAVGSGSVAFATAQPSWGRIALPDATTAHRMVADVQGSRPDYRPANAEGGFAVSADASAVAALALDNQVHRFDLGALRRATLDDVPLESTAQPADNDDAPPLSANVAAPSPGPAANADGGGGWDVNARQADVAAPPGVAWGHAANSPPAETAWRRPALHRESFEITALLTPALVRINGHDVALAERERALSGDVAADSRRAVLGTDFHVMTVDAAGAVLDRLRTNLPVWAIALSAAGDRAVAALGDGTFRWYSIGGGGALAERAGAYLESGGPRWVAWRGDGYFAHSEQGGTDLVGYALNGTRDSLTGQWFSFASLYELYYRPELVSAALDAADTAPGVDLSAVAERFQRPTVEVTKYCYDPDTKPNWRTRSMDFALEAEAEEKAKEEVVEGPACGDTDDVTRGHARRDDGGLGTLLASTSGQLDITLRLRDTGGGVSHVDALLNGRNVGRFPLSDAAKAETRKPEGAALTVSLPVDVGENRLILRAFNEFGVYRESGEVFFEGGRPAADEIDERVLYMVGIGVDAYSGIQRLFFAVKDARSVIEHIRDHAPRSHYDVVAEPVYLTDGDATREEIRRVLGDIAEKADQNDAVLIYFAGHGKADEQGYVFIPIDVTSRDAYRDSGLSENSLIADLGNIVSTDLLLILDTCHAGGFSAKGPGEIAHLSGRYVLTASASEEEAIDGIGENGLFATAVLDGLAGGAALSGAREVGVLTLGYFVQLRVSELARQKNHQQQAVFKAVSDRLGPFPLVSLADPTSTGAPPTP